MLPFDVALQIVVELASDRTQVPAQGLREGRKPVDRRQATDDDPSNTKGSVKSSAELRLLLQPCAPTDLRGDVVDTE